MTNQPPQDPYAGNEFGSMIPTANKEALIGYYFGFGSLLPFIGILFSIPAIIFGMKGLKKVQDHPQVKGKVHALIGIIFGGLQIFFFTAFMLIVLLGASQQTDTRGPSVSSHSTLF